MRMANDIGLVGLGVMGQNLALNIESHGYTVSGYSLPLTGVREFIEGKAAGRRILGCSSLDELAGSLAAPRKVLLMVPAGKPVDDVLDGLLPLLSPGDVVIDGGNSHFKDTAQRLERAREAGVHYIGMGVSGGEEGALNGPALMPGGSAEAWRLVKDLLTSIAAKAGPAGDEPCCEWIGPGGAGHFVKMVHNAIEYADMQMISEAYWFMKTILGMDQLAMQAAFAKWNGGSLKSYLIEITAAILGKRDEDSGRYLLDAVLDVARQKGTGAWTAEAAFELGTPVPSLVEAVIARFMSAAKDERREASKVLAGPRPQASRQLGQGGQAGRQIAQAPVEFNLQKLQGALYAAKMIAYAQGFRLLGNASREYGWGLDCPRIARIWRNGCIIRADFLDDIAGALQSAPEAGGLLLAPKFAADLARTQSDLRLVVETAARSGIPVPGFSSALTYYDSCRSERLPANLIQAQRDCFGAHGYEREDRPGAQHSKWTET